MRLKIDFQAVGNSGYPTIIALLRVTSEDWGLNGLGGLWAFEPSLDSPEEEPLELLGHAMENTIGKLRVWGYPSSTLSDRTGNARVDRPFLSDLPLQQLVSLRGERKHKDEEDNGAGILPWSNLEF